jgi:hypothetical protein
VPLVLFILYFRMIKEGCISFEYLKYLFKVGDKVVGTRDKLKLGAVIKTIHPTKEDSYSFKVDADVICSNGEKLYFSTESFYILFPLLPILFCSSFLPLPFALISMLLPLPFALISMLLPLSYICFIDTAKLSTNSMKQHNLLILSAVMQQKRTLLSLRKGNNS